MVRKAYWEVALEGFYVNGADMKISTTAAIDSGTSLLALPPAMAKNINRQVGAKPFFLKPDIYYVDCKKYEANALPKVELVFAGKKFAMEGRDYVFKMGPLCISVFSSMKTPDDMWIVGDAFLRRYYSVYDAKNDRVGFAEAVHA